MILELSKATRKALKFQISIDTTRGDFSIDGLPLTTSMLGRGVPDVFKVRPEAFYYDVELDDKARNVVYTSKLTIDRYSGIAREAQATEITGMPDKTMFKSGEYQCQVLEKPKF